MSEWLKAHPIALPTATLLVNVLGCLVVGLALPWLLAREADSATHHARLLVVIGVLGAFTTYSTFGVETFELWRSGRWGLSLGYVACHLVLGLAAVGAGVWVSERLSA